MNGRVALALFLLPHAVSSAFAQIGPAGLPQHIGTRLNIETNKSLEAPDVKERMASLGLEPIIGTPERFAQFIREEIVKWGKVVKDSGARAD